MIYDAAIIGAGVVGGMIGRALSAYDLKICMLESKGDVAMGASHANSAIVHAGFDCEPGTLKAKLNVRGSEMMEETARQLGVPYYKNTSIVIGFEGDEEKIKHLYDKGIANGVKELSVISGDEARALEPRLSDKVECALLAKTGAIICPYELTIAAVGNAMDNGAELKTDFEVKSITEKDGVYTVSSDTEEIRAKYVINCAGVYSDKIAGMAGVCDFTITPRRGEYYVLDKECGKTVSATIFRAPTAMGKGILVTRTVDGNLLLGPTAENIEDKEDVSTTDSGLNSVKVSAEEMVPGIPVGRQTITTFCGLRSVGSTHDFIINNPKPGFVNVAGIESPGLSSSPAIAEYVVDMLAKAGMKLEKKADFNPFRRGSHWFRSLSIAEKNEVIRKDPAYGRIVCRCESVTEGEIRDAIVRNPKAHDVDGVKRRTRSGMGRCQGGFCMPVVMELLSELNGVPYENITKSGKGSYIMVGKTKENN